MTILLWILGPIALLILTAMFVIHIWGDKILDKYVEYMFDRLGFTDHDEQRKLVRQKFNDDAMAQRDLIIRETKAGPSSLVNAGLFAGLSKMDRKAYHKAYQIKNKDKISIQQKEYKLKHKDKIKAYQKAYRIKNSDKMKAYRKVYNAENKDKIDEYNRLRRVSK